MNVLLGLTPQPMTFRSCGAFHFFTVPLFHKYIILCVVLQIGNLLGSGNGIAGAMICSAAFHLFTVPQTDTLKFMEQPF